MMNNQNLFKQLEQKAKTLHNVITRTNGQDKSTIRKLYAEIKALLHRLKGTNNAQYLYKALGACAMLFLPFFNQQAKAQSFTVDSTAFNLPDGYYFAMFAIADLDNDGDQDIMIGEYYGVINYYENVGTPQSPVFTLPSQNPFGFSPSGSSYVAIPFLGDIDDDGDLDLFVNDEYAQIRFYENVGTSTTPQFQFTSTNPYNIGPAYLYTIPKFADMDADGDLDIMYGDLNNSISFQENIGTPSSPNFSNAVMNPFNINVLATYYNAIDLADMDNDGDLDIMAGGEEEFKFIENIGTPSTPNFGTTVMSPFGLDYCYYAYSIDVADMDADGDMDFFATTYYGDIIYYENQEIVAIDQNDQTQLSIYPNPTQDQVYINNETNIHQVRIIDPSGKTVLQQKTNDNDLVINVNYLRSGIYFIEVSTKEEVYHQQFIKK